MMEHPMTRFAFLSSAIFCVLLTTAQAQPQQQQQNPFDGLHRALNLGPQQEDGWKAFQQSYAMDPAAMARQRDAGAAMARMTAPQRVDQSIAMMRDDLEAEQRRGTALKAFYATLTPQQQRTFDRETLQQDGPPQ
jgi:methylphosphotriester-DNA--protein-cysteine methyltransferase